VIFVDPYYTEVVPAGIGLRVCVHGNSKSNLADGYALVPMTSSDLEKYDEYEYVLGRITFIAPLPTSPLQLSLSR